MNSHREGIKRALRDTQDLFEFDDLVNYIAHGKAQLWVGEESLVITEIKDYPRGLVGNVWLGTGKLTELMDSQKQLEEFFKSYKCKYIEYTGRDWRKLLKHDKCLFHLRRKL